MATDSRVLDVDPMTGLRRIFHYDDDTGDFTIQTEHDVEGLIEQNKAEASNVGDGWKGDMHKVASIPLSVYFALKAQGIIDPRNDPEYKKLRAWLNDSDNRFFRTRGGRV